jgi:hypothetical protein
MRCLNAALRVAAGLLLFAFGGAGHALSNNYAGSINLAVDRWLVVQKPSGFLPYGFDFLQDEASEPNTMSPAHLTRQAGAASALADYYALTRDPRAPPAIQRFLSAFGRHSLPIGKSRAQTLVESTRLLSMPFGRYKIHAALERSGLLYEKDGPGKVLSPDGDYSMANTGSTALALLTELRYSQTSGDHRFADLRRAWLEGLIANSWPMWTLRFCANTAARSRETFSTGEPWRRQHVMPTRRTGNSWNSSRRRQPASSITKRTRSITTTAARQLRELPMPWGHCKVPGKETMNWQSGPGNG